MTPTIEDSKTWHELQVRLYSAAMVRATTAIVPQAVLLWIVWDTTAPWLLAFLSVSAIVMHAARVLIIKRGVKRIDLSESEISALMRRITFSTTFHGAWIGLTIALCGPSSGLEWAAVMTVIGSGIQAAAIATLAIYPGAFAGFMIPIVVGTSLCWIAIGAEFALVIAPLLTLKTLILYAYVKNANKIMRRSYDLRVERNQALAEAEQANQLRSKFLAAASHDLRQPAAALAFMAEELKEYEFSEEITPVIENIHRSSDSINGLLDKLFDLSKLETPIISNTPQWCSIERLINELQSSFEAKARNKSLEFKCEFVGGYLFADATHTLRLLNNLVDNAIKYTDKGSVNLKVSLIGDMLVATVTDTGKGIERAQLERIWAEYYRASGSRVGGDFSLGLGLAIVRRLGDLINAQVTLESELGQGTTASVRFPIKLYSDRVEPSQQPFPTGPLRGAQGHRILLVEDNHDVAEALDRHLQRLGFAVDMVFDAPAARALIVSDQTYLLLISDNRLPDNESGVVLCAYANTDSRELPAIIISADKIAAGVDMPEGITAILKKPIQSNLLRTTLQDILSNTT